MSTAPARMLPETYTWGFPGSPLEIRMQLSVVHEMSRRLGNTAGANGNSRLEGGLLLGQKPRLGITQMTGFRPLSELDATSIEQALAENDDEVVGFYRATGVGDLSVSESDTGLAKRFFAEPGSIVLLIESNGPVAGKAVFAFWDQDSITEFPLMEFPFDGYQLALAEAERNTRQRVPLEKPAAMDLHATAALPASSPRKLRGLSLSLLMVAAVSAGYFWLHRRPAAPPTPSKPAVVAPPGIPANTLGLAAERRGSDLLLSWDTSSPTIAKATFGMLLIRGDGGDRQIALSAEQLRAGKVLYTLTSEESEIQLNVIERDKVTRDSVVVVLARKPGDQKRLQAKPGSPDEHSAEDDGSDTTPSRPTSGHEPLKAFTRPVATRPVGASASIGEPPSVAWNPSAAGAGNSINATVPTVPALPGLPAPAASSEPRASAKSSDPQTALRARAPVPLRQPAPKITDPMKGVLSRAVSVQLKLSIDAKGRVARTESVTGGVNPLLLEASKEAARFWTFQPALIDNKPVPSEMIVTFHFAAAR